MILLDKNKYDKVIEPLNQVSINNLFAHSVIKKHVKGLVYVDNEAAPETFLVVHPYNMSLLFGKTDNDNFNSKLLDYALNTFEVRYKHEWMQAFDDSWDSVLAELFGDRLIKAKDNSENVRIECIELNTRVNFEFNIDKYLALKPQKLNNTSFRIARADRETYQDMKGSVVPMYFWDDAEHFYNNGIGFSLFYEDKLASTAYSAFIQDNQLEIGIETIEEYRGKGFARYTCAVLIDYCLEYNYEPVWSCRLENIGSYILAQKLGFDETIKIPYYRLNAARNKKMQ